MVDQETLGSPRRDNKTNVPQRKRHFGQSLVINGAVSSTTFSIIKVTKFRHTYYKIKKYLDYFMHFTLVQSISLTRLQCIIY